MSQVFGGFTDTNAGGDVAGPSSSTDGDIASFSGTTGKIIADSGRKAASVTVGPGATTDRAIATWNGTGGTTLNNNTGVTITANNSLVAVASAAATNGISATGNTSGHGVSGTGGSSGSGVRGTATDSGTSGYGLEAVNSSGGYAFVVNGDTTSPVRPPMRQTPADALPSGAGLVGDLIITNFSNNVGMFYICVGAATPGVYSVVGDQTRPVPSTLTTSGTGITIDWRTGRSQVFDAEGSSGNITLTLTNPLSGTRYIVKGIQGSTSRTLTWSPAVKWAGGIAPTFSVANDAVDVFELWYDGSSYYGQIFGQAMS